MEVRDILSYMPRFANLDVNLQDKAMSRMSFDEVIDFMDSKLKVA